MRIRAKVGLLVAALCAALLPMGPARASFHLNLIREVFAGTANAPNAEYVELQMWANGQNFVSGQSIIVYDDTDTEIARFEFADNVANGLDQSYILVATPEAETLFGVQADLEMTASLPSSGGKVCFGGIDCVAWGTFPAGDPTTGAPFGASSGLPVGQAIVRDISDGDPNQLEGADDTDDSASDFGAGQALPRNNSGDRGHLPGEPLPDTDAPVSRIVKPADSVTYKASRLTTWTGTARDATDVEGVDLALRMAKTGGGCAWFDGSRFKKRSCSKKLFFATVTGEDWSFDAPRLKPSFGSKIKHYILFSRARDSLGNREETFERGRNSNLFEIK
ncbi:MAG: hypothetical protein QOG54_267 [Actinomycetota bacterium]|nr:hypothetical protein [Actinomycetota bacterium]